MNPLILKQPSNVSLEIAASAAVYVADHGLDYGQAKRKAYEQIIGAGSKTRDAMPDNGLVDDALFEHLELFDPDHQARVKRMRLVALKLMRELAQFEPMLAGAVWKGIVADHVPIHIQTFSDNTKEVGFALLNLGIDYDPVELPHFKDGRDGKQDGMFIEGMTMHWQGEPIMISLYDLIDQRGAIKEKVTSGQRMGMPKRGNIVALQSLLQGA